MKNLQEQIKRINRLSDYQVGITITEQRPYNDLENIPKPETPSSPPPKSETPPPTSQDLSGANLTFNELLDGVNSVIPNYGKKLVTSLLVGVIGNGIHSLLQRKQTKELEKLISHFKVVIDNLDQKEIDCLMTKNVPIKLFNIKRIVNKKDEIKKWLTTCIKDEDKLKLALDNVTTVIEAYREIKNVDGYYTY